MLLCSFQQQVLVRLYRGKGSQAPQGLHPQVKIVGKKKPLCELNNCGTLLLRTRLFRCRPQCPQIALPSIRQHNSKCCLRPHSSKRTQCFVSRLSIADIVLGDMLRHLVVLPTIEPQQAQCRDPYQLIRALCECDAKLSKLLRIISVHRR